MTHLDFMKKTLRDLDHHVEGVQANPPMNVIQAWATALTVCLTDENNLERLSNKIGLLGEILKKTYSAGYIAGRNNATIIPPTAGRG